MSWEGYINLIKGAKADVVSDVAIVGYAPGVESVWCGTGPLLGITAAEIQKLGSNVERESIFTHGLMLGGEKCRVIRDDLFTDDNCMTLGMPGNHCVYVKKLKTALIIVKGMKGIHGRELIVASSGAVSHLASSGI